MQNYSSEKINNDRKEKMDSEDKIFFFFQFLLKFQSRKALEYESLSTLQYKMIIKIWNRITAAFVIIILHKVKLAPGLFNMSPLMQGLINCVLHAFTRTQCICMTAPRLNIYSSNMNKQHKYEFGITFSFVIVMAPKCQQGTIYIP